MTAPVEQAAERPFPTDRCRSCEAGIIWAYTGRTSMPVDAEPSSKGNIRLRWESGAVHAQVVAAHRAFGAKDLRTSHFVTCPNADKWRQSRGRMDVPEARRRIKGDKR